MARWAMALLIGLALAGCGGGSGDDDREGGMNRQGGFDLTGCWAVNERPLCLSGLHSDAELADLELGRVEAPPRRLTQTGNRLDITDVDSGRLMRGTVEGNRVRYGDHDTAPDLEVVLEADGSVVSEDAIDVAETFVFSSDGAAVEVVCEMRLERLPDVSSDECGRALEDG